MLNKKIGILALITMLGLSGCSLFQKKITPYAFNTAVLEFSQTGNTQGTTTLYIKGDKTARETHVIQQATSVDGQTKLPDEKIDGLYINSGEKIYQIDLNKKTGYQKDNELYAELKKISAEKRMDYLKRAILGINGENTEIPAPKGQKEIAGQKCDVYEIQGISEVCIWNGITIYEKTTYPDLNIDSMAIATKIETDVNIPDEKFNIPVGIELK